MDDIEPDPSTELREQRDQAVDQRAHVEREITRVEDALGRLGGTADSYPLVSKLGRLLLKKDRLTKEIAEFEKGESQ